ncbi:MAG TPA: hypothetical protein VF469_21255 [Kofleriaceae bacterium]
MRGVVAAGAQDERERRLALPAHGTIEREHAVKQLAPVQVRREPIELGEQVGPRRVVERALAARRRASQNGLPFAIAWAVVVGS